MLQSKVETLREAIWAEMHEQKLYHRRGESLSYFWLNPDSQVANVTPFYCGIPSTVCFLFWEKGAKMRANAPINKMTYLAEDQNRKWLIEAA